MLRSYRFDKYRTEQGRTTSDQDEVATADLPPRRAGRGEGRLERPPRRWSQGVRQARDLVSEPANVLSPEQFAEACRKLGERLGMEVDVLGPAAMRELGMNALLAVGQGSAPRVPGRGDALERRQAPTSRRSR